MAQQYRCPRKARRITRQPTTDAGCGGCRRLSVYLVADGSHSDMDEQRRPGPQRDLRSGDRAGTDGKSFARKTAMTSSVGIRPLTIASTRSVGRRAPARESRGGAPPSQRNRAARLDWLVGNTRACLYRDNRLEHLTTDQSVVGQLVSQGKLSEAAAPSHPQAGVLYRPSAATWCSAR